MIRCANGSILLCGAVLVMLACSAAADEKAQPSAREETSAPAPRRLDLRPPDITRIYTPEQIDRVLANTFDENIDKDLEEVEVERERERLAPRSPTVWPAIAAPFWAILHPLQAWRIIAPLPPDQTRVGYERTEATSGYLEPAAPAHP